MLVTRRPPAHGTLRCDSRATRPIGDCEGSTSPAPRRWPSRRSGSARCARPGCRRPMHWRPGGRPSGRGRAVASSLAVDEHEVFLGDVVGIVRVARLLEALAYGLDPFVSLVGDVGDLGRGSFEMRLPLGRVVHRTAEVSLGGLVVADQDALNQVVLGGLDLDDRGREMLVSDRDHFVGRGRLRGACVVESAL